MNNRSQWSATKDAGRQCLALVMALFVCQVASASENSAGRESTLTLAFVEATETALIFKFHNATSRAKYFFSTEPIGAVAIPSETAFDCLKEGVGASVSGFPITDSVNRNHKPPRTKVLPHETIMLQVNLAVERGLSLAAFKGGRCRVRFLLTDRTMVESEEFSL